MTVTSHISQLRLKHAALDKRISDATKRPGLDDLEITQLKRRKLQLKEEIARLSAAE